jgi:fatty-acid desaturase
MQPVHRVDGKDANPSLGDVLYDLPKLYWNLGMICGAIIMLPFYLSLESFILFLCLTYLSLLVGHSVGMHRMMIHRAFECHPLVEKILIYIGVLVGMSGPFGIIKIHDIRDWAQRQDECHDFFSHRQNYVQDLWWQLTGKFNFENPPRVSIEDKYSADRFYQWLESSWRYHQALLGLVLYYIGGWEYVVWGIFVRVSVSIIGHWSMTYFCHNPGPGKWRVKGAAVQASNIPGLGVITYGECWHNNHHAFPESARIGLEAGQSDPAWLLIQLLARLGIARNIGVPRAKTLQDDLEKAVSQEFGNN